MCEGTGKPSKNCTFASPFGGEAGKLGREAFSLAVDRDQLVDIACSKGTACIKATGGVITKGLKGYLGDNTDPWAVFDKAKAQQLYKQSNILVVASHDPELLHGLCNKAILLDHGKVVALGPLDEIARRYAEGDVAEPAPPQQQPAA